MATPHNTIEKHSAAYRLLKGYVDFLFKHYFRTTVSGIENIPKRKGLIFAMNHHNALMDALGLITVKSWQLVFLARADIFEKPLLNKILTSLKILPVYRMRDGYANLLKNDETFNKTQNVLKHGDGIVILPEGNHDGKKRLRRLKKGIARIAFQSEDASDGELDLHVVPIGIDYTDYIKVGSRLHIRFGIPIRVKPMLKLYRENAAQGYNLLLEMLAKGIKAEMIDIEDEKYYAGYKAILDIFTTPYLKGQGIINRHSNRIDAQKVLISKIDELKRINSDDFLVLIANALEYNMITDKLSLEPKYFPASLQDRLTLIPLFLLLLATLPLFIFSIVNNIFPLSITYFAAKRIKDRQFISSFRFVLGILLLPFFHILQIIVFAALEGSLLYIAIYAISLPLSVFVFFKWNKAVRIYFRKLREVFHSLANQKRVKRAKQLHQIICKKMWEELNRKSDEDYMPSYLLD